jgi:hypothetical protein
MTTREKLPNKREGETVKLRFGAHRHAYHVTTGYYADGRIGEVFVNGGKAGSEAEALARDGAVLISIGLQHGVPLATMRDAVTRNRDGSPQTVVGAVLDLIAPRERDQTIEPTHQEEKTDVSSEEPGEGQGEAGGD